MNFGTQTSHKRGRQIPKRYLSVDHSCKPSNFIPWQIRIFPHPAVDCDSTQVGDHKNQWTRHLALFGSITRYKCSMTHHEVLQKPSKGCWHFWSWMGTILDELQNAQGKESRPLNSIVMVMVAFLDRTRTLKIISHLDATVTVPRVVCLSKPFSN